MTFGAYPLGDGSAEEKRLEDYARSFPQRRLFSLVRPGMRVLDVGCGPGAMSHRIAGRVGSQGAVVGVDLSTAHLRAAARRVPDGEFVLGDGTSLPFEDDSFDLAFAKLVMAYVSSPEQMAAELLRVVRPGGNVVVADMDGGAFLFDPADSVVARGWKFVEQMFWSGGADPWIGRRIPGLLRKAGLTSMRIATTDACGHDHSPEMRVALRRQVRGMLMALRRCHELDDPELDLLVEALDGDAAGEFMAMGGVTVSGRVP